MLTRNYVAIADRTQRPFQESRSVRSSRGWSWTKKHAKPGACVKINPQAYDKEQGKC